MIVLNATPELRLTFEKLIQTMEVPVRWNGLFVVIDNTLILQGDVRSLFFHFDSRKVVTNVIDLDIPVQKITPIENNNYVKNVVNMLLYAFGKWGNIKGLTVEKDYIQLSRLFANILGEMEIEPEYTKDHFWFYQKGVRIVYEEVVECAVSYKEKEPEIPEEESKGLWHKLIWKQAFLEFPVQETTLKERNRNRLGNNFYLCNYVCPDCKNKMHGVVYPVGDEFVIDTKEGRIQIARAYTCAKCFVFYTPRPKRLLIDGDCYVMDFAGDKAAYQDYQELLGRKGGKACNPNYNIYLDKKKPGGIQNRMSDRKTAESRGLEELEEKLGEIDELSKHEVEELYAKVTEGFFPEKVIEPIEREIWKKYEARKRGEKTTGGIKGFEKKDKKDPLKQKKEEKSGKEELEKENKKEKKEVLEKAERYKTRLDLFPRLSERQRNELMQQISTDTAIPMELREELLQTARKRKRQDNFEKLKEKTVGAKNKNRLLMLRVYEEIKEAELEEAERKQLFDLTGVTPKEFQDYLYEKEENAVAVEERRIRGNAGAAGTVELKQSENKIVSKKEYMSALKKEIEKKGTVRKGTERKGIERKEIERKEAEREEIEKAEAQKPEKWGRNASAIRNKAADIREIESMIRKTRSASRADLQELLENLMEQDFDEDVLEPYKEHVKSQIQRIDEAYLDSLLDGMEELSSEDGVEVYEEIRDANILPELKANALKQLEKRLSKIKSEECELLMQKLQKEMEEAGVKEPDKHHYYPAKRVFMKEVSEEEVEVIHYAKAAYGAGIGPFEYPIWAVDTTRNGSGEKGMFLTPEHIFYSNLTTSYRISVFAIDRIEAAAGFLNRGLYVYQKNGQKTKLPYVVETTELPKLAGVLDAFIKYLQEKPFSRKESYLAKERHSEICCFRCGYVYRGTFICPKCGYKANQ